MQIMNERYINQFNSMGNQHRNYNNPTQTHINHSLKLYQWRADPLRNPNLPRVYLTNQKTQSTQQLYHIIQSQLQHHHYVDISAITQQLNARNKEDCPQMFMSFEKYVAKLTMLERKLGLGEIIWTLKIMLEGYETIWQEMGKVSVGLQLGFLTEEGQLRVWINSNHISNQLQQLNGKEGTSREIIQTEARIIDTILQVCVLLARDVGQYYSFYHELKAFVGQNILSHYTFREVRKYINGYVWRRKINLPGNLACALQRIKQQLRQQGKTQDQQQQQKQATFSSLSHHSPQSSLRQFTEQLDFSNASSRQEIIPNKISKISLKKSSHIKRLNESTCMNSQFAHSREASQIHYNINHEHTSKHFPKITSAQQQNMKYVKTRKNIKAYTQNNEKNHFHSKQTSFDPHIASQFISPQAQMVEASNQSSKGLHFSRNLHPTHYQSSKQESLQENHGPLTVNNSYNAVGQRVSYRHAYSLLQNKQMNLCSSKGSFQSMRNSNYSDYNGYLLNMARSAKLVCTPSLQELGYDQIGYIKEQE